MKVLTDPQVNEVIKLLLEIEKATCKEQAIVWAEKIRAMHSSGRTRHAKA
jgi:hypothetical protein